MITAHQLARLLLAQPDLPVVFGKDTPDFAGNFIAKELTFKVTETGLYIDEVKPDETFHPTENLTP
jgi:hypothetical protein